MHGNVFLDRFGQFGDTAEDAVAKTGSRVSRKNRSTMLSQDAEVGVK